MGRGRNRAQGHWEDEYGDPHYEEDAYGYQGPDEEEEYEPLPPPRRRSSSTRARRRSRRKRRTLPTLITGCLLGALITIAVAGLIVFLTVRSAQSLPSTIGVPGIGATKQFTHDESTQVNLLGPLTQVQICNNIGNISANIDPNATNATVATHKTVHADTQANADKEFANIAVEVQPPGPINKPLTCATSTTSTTPGAAGGGSTGGNGTMIVNATVPSSNQSLIHGSNDSVDLTITLPKAALPSDPTLAINISTAVGDTNVTGLSGVYTIKGSSGNVTIQRAILADGSRIETGQGNVSFGGFLANSTSNPQPRYTLQSEQGNIDVTLPADTNLTLNANTNVGKITSDFGTAIPPGNSNNGPVNYHGPLSPTGTASQAELILDVSTGDVNIHKAAS